MDNPEQRVTRLLEAFRHGVENARNELLEHFQPWLRMLARMQMESRLQAKFDPSDVVQQTLIAADRDLPQFRGKTEAEFTAWLRQILAHTLAHEIRRYHGTQKRNVDREVSLDQQLAASSQRFGDLLAAGGTSPSQKAVHVEREIRLAQILERLPDDYREIILLRHLEGLTHEAIAQRMGRNAGAVRMLWVRALARLRAELESLTGSGSGSESGH